MRRLSILAALILCSACPASQQAPAACPPVAAATPASVAPPNGPVATAALPAQRDTDEGMWLLNDFPSARLQKLHGFAPSAEWLEHVRLSSVRLARGCSGSLVSSRGLVMTNHHCAEECIEELSTKTKNLDETGFSASTEAREARCPNMEINQLETISDVTTPVLAALKGVAGADYADTRKAALAAIEKECTTGDDVRCDVVDLYHGGAYHLYKYRRFQDVRLVFAPELAIAFFGGDPDNFNFPRFDLDVSFVRIYDKGAPLATPQHFKWSPAGAKEGELTFVSGHPGRTDRLLTVSQLEYRRDVRLPERLLWWSELRGVLTDFAQRGPEQKRISRGELFDFENSIKAYKGRLESLRDAQFLGAKVVEERALRDRVTQDPALSQTVGGAWDAIEQAQQARRRLHDHHDLLEDGEGFASKLFEMARTLVRSADELGKPNDKRLREYGDANLPAVKRDLLSQAPIYAELESLTLGASLVHLREVLGPDDAVVKKVLGPDEPRELARRLVAATKLKDSKARKALFDGGKAAVEASKDPMIDLARRIDGDARAVRKAYEDAVETVETRNGELLAKARFAAYGTSQYPDATFTLRLSYGVVRGWNENGKDVAPFTTFGGAFERATGKEPFDLPKTWLEARAKIDPSTPFNFVTTNDIIGGNSGSPVFDQNAQIVGLIFDGNIHSLGGAFGFDDQKNRAVAVHSRALSEALAKIYGAGRIVDELGK